MSQKETPFKGMGRGAFGTPRQGIQQPDFIGAGNAGLSATVQRKTPTKPASVSSLSSTSTSIQKNRLKTMEEIAKLDDEIEDIEHEIDVIRIQMQEIEEEIQHLEQQGDDSVGEQLSALKQSLRKIRVNRMLKEKEVEKLRKKYHRRKEILKQKEELANNELADEVENVRVDVEVDDVDAEQRTGEWAQRNHAVIEEDEGNQESDGTEEHYEDQPGSRDNQDVQSVGDNDDVTPTNHVQANADGNVPVSPQNGNLSYNTAMPRTTYYNQHQPQIGRSRQPRNDIQELASILKNMSTTTPTYSKEEKELPHFSGDPASWGIFYKEYQRISQIITSSQMLIQLRKSLQGPAKDLVYHYFSDSGNIPTIMEELEARFGQADYILDALASRAKSAPDPKINKPESIIQFGTAVKTLVVNVHTYKEPMYLQSKELLKSLVGKLSPEMEIDWIRWVRSDSERKLNLENFAEWIGEEVRIAYQRCPPTSTTAVAKDEKPKRNRHIGAINEVKSEKKQSYCTLCNEEGHHIKECRKFARLNLEERVGVVKEKNLCFGCLVKGHTTAKCKKKKPCGKNGCPGRHHPLIHDESRAKKPVPESAPTQNAPTENAASSSTAQHIGHVGDSGKEALLWYLPVKVRKCDGAKEHRTYVMYDPGCITTLTDNKVSEALGVTGPEEVINFSVFDGEEKSKKSKKVSFQIAGDYPNAKFHTIGNVTSISDLDLPTQSYDIDAIRKKHPYLKGAPLKSQKNVKPLILIGQDNHDLSFYKDTVWDGKKGNPKACKTALGWFLMGSECSTANKRGIYQINVNPEKQLAQLFKEFICMDNFGVNESPTVRSREDVKAMEIMEATTKRVGERWETGLLWRDQEAVIPESKQAALKRLYSTERRADKDEAFGELYCSRFQEYIDKGYLQFLENASEEKRNQFPSKTPIKSRKWYLPHFFALHPNKKPRLVFDAAAKANGKSFNDFFYTGPDNLRPLPEVLLRFRKHKVGLIGDITAMFHQVNLRKEDQPMQTILYRGMDRSSPPKEYAMTPLFFGSVCSPSSAIYVKDRNAKEFEDQLPNAVKRIVGETYMDDFLSGADTPEDAIQLQQQVTYIHGKGGFPIAKWNSSSKEVLSKIPEEIRAVGEKEFHNKSEVAMEKTLGHLWNSEEDYFTFLLNTSKLPEAVKDGSRAPTKREVASFVMSLFDPLGFLTPLKLQGLRIFQDTWRRQKDEPVLEWNDELPEHLSIRWTKWLDDLKNTLEGGRLKIPRCVRRSSNSDTKYQLHTFVDASEEAYSAVVYLRSETDGEVEVSFLCGKGRVAPIKGLTIPRMELNAALMGARLAAAVKRAYEDEISIDGAYYWSDSRTVMCWILSESGRFSQYVSNRINEIHSLSKPDEWRWVPTKENAADDATRSELNYEFQSECRWLCGSKFLSEPEEKWPSLPAPAAKDKDLEEKVTVMHVHSDKKLPLPDVNKFSAWWPLIRFGCDKTAIWVSAFNNLPKFKKDVDITSEDIEKAERLWCKKVQTDCFAEEYRRLKQGLPVGPRSRLYKLSPALKDGLIVFNGRIGQAPFVSESVKTPILLDPQHPYTRLLIKRYHIVNAHQGQETVINNIKKKYHVLDCRSAVKSTIHRCGVCRIARAKPAQQEMGELPEGRMAIREPPFTHTGVDLFGPMEVTVGRRREKRWGVLFTCLTTRAVTLDLVPSCSTSDFLDCLIRFNCRRGPVMHLYSDNATNFKGADNEIKQCMKQWDHKKLKDDLLAKSATPTNGPIWHFNAPASPHMGGSWERLIGLAKKVLSNIVSERTPKEYTLLTVLAEVENILNSRPLSTTSPDPKDPECLTPNHILKLRCTPGQFIPGEYSDEIPRKMWRYGQRIAEDFWKRWTDECLPLLLPRKRWVADQPSIREGDIVFLLDDQMRRSDWKKGVVDKTFTGRDRKIRVVDVRVPIIENGEFIKFVIYRRHLQKLCPLGVNVNDETLSHGRENVSE